MKNTFLIIFLVLLVALGFYLLGKKNSSNNITADIVQNVALVKEIAELSAVDVSGTTKIRISNKGDNATMFERLKNYFAENTLELSIPYEAKYGVDMANQKVDINQRDSVVYIYFPKCSLLSLQLRLDKVDAISKTGIFNSMTIEDVTGAQKKLYEDAAKLLEGNEKYLQMARERIEEILQKYYTPLNLKVICVFGDVPLRSKVLPGTLN